jgi:hypothetical protein
MKFTTFQLKPLIAGSIESMFRRQIEDIQQAVERIRQQQAPVEIARHKLRWLFEEDEDEPPKPRVEKNSMASNRARIDESVQKTQSKVKIPGVSSFHPIGAGQQVVAQSRDEQQRIIQQIIDQAKKDRGEMPDSDRTVFHQHALYAAKHPGSWAEFMREAARKYPAEYGNTPEATMYDGRGGKRISR